METGSPSVLAFLRRYQDDSVLVIANLAASSQQAALRLPAAVYGTNLTDILDDIPLERAGSELWVIPLDRHTCRWFRLEPLPEYVPCEAYATERGKSA